MPRFSSGWGERKRSTAVTMMAPAATKMRMPSTPAEKYSALLCPKLWFLSGGLIATRNATSATTAATRLTTDSAASESRPTEPVSSHAPALSEMVMAAAAMDSHAYRVRSTGWAWWDAGTPSIETFPVAESTDPPTFGDERQPLTLRHEGG